MHFYFINTIPNGAPIRGQVRQDAGDAWEFEWSTVFEAVRPEEGVEGPRAGCAPDKEDGRGRQGEVAKPKNAEWRQNLNLNLLRKLAGLGKGSLLEYG